jgi:hypothetical protein
VVDPLTEDQGIVVIDVIRHSVWPAARAVHAGQLAAQRLADAAGSRARAPNANSITSRR